MGWEGMSWSDMNVDWDRRWALVSTDRRWALVSTDRRWALVSTEKKFELLNMWGVSWLAEKLADFHIHGFSWLAGQVTKNRTQTSVLLVVPAIAERLQGQCHCRETDSYWNNLHIFSIKTQQPQYQIPFNRRPTRFDHNDHCQWRHCITVPSAIKCNHLLTYLLHEAESFLRSWPVNFAASQEIPRIYGTRKFLTVPTSARHLSLSWANSIQSPRPPLTSWRSTLILSSHLRLGLPSGRMWPLLVLFSDAVSWWGSLSSMTDERVIKKHGEMVLTGENRSTGEKANLTCNGQVLDLYVRSQRPAFG